MICRPSTKKGSIHPGKPGFSKNTLEQVDIWSRGVGVGSQPAVRTKFGHKHKSHMSHKCDPNIELTIPSSKTMEFTVPSSKRRESAYPIQQNNENLHIPSSKKGGIHVSHLAKKLTIQKSGQFTYFHPAKGSTGAPLLLMDTILHHFETMVETIVCWYAQGNQHSRPS